MSDKGFSFVCVCCGARATHGHCKEPYCEKCYDEVKKNDKGR